MRPQGWQKRHHVKQSPLSPRKSAHETGGIISPLRQQLSTGSPEKALPERISLWRAFVRQKVHFFSSRRNDTSAGIFAEENAYLFAFVFVP